MTSVDAAVRYDGATGNELARRLHVPRVALAYEVDSTMDVAHALAAGGAPAGTVALAERQRRGRGRTGKKWESPEELGIWMTLLERDVDPDALGVLSLRVGLRIADALDRFAGEALALKWPNDLFLGDRKVGGILVEARWRGAHADWVAIGVGINVSAAPTDVERATSLRSASRPEVLGALVPAVRDAARARGLLTPDELRAFAARDWGRGKRATAPAAGVVEGISASGALIVRQGGSLVECTAGSLILEASAP